jgi:nucleotide-binding universal stress UspA family protein
MQADRRYLESLTAELTGLGLHVDAHLAMGDPASELVKVAEEQNVDLVAMSTHGHRFLSDVIHGATADRVRHLLKVPVLLLRAQ